MPLMVKRISDLEAGLRYNAEMQAYTVKATGFEEAPFDELYRNYSPASTTSGAG